MTATFIHQGDAIDHVPTTDLEAGSVVVLNDLVGITTRSIPAGHLGALQLRGVFDMPKRVGKDHVIATGKKVYWNPNQSVVQDAPANSVFVGYAVRDAAGGDPTVRVRLGGAA